MTETIRHIFLILSVMIMVGLIDGMVHANSPNAGALWMDPTHAFAVPYHDEHDMPRPYINGAQRVALVRSVDDLKEGIRQAHAGDAIVLEDGVYHAFESVVIRDKHGTEDAPIVITAKNIGEPVMAGSLQFIIENSSFIVIEGLDFQTSSGGAPGYSGRRTHSAVILNDAYRTRITRNRFALREVHGGTSLRDWLSVDGSRGGYNRIDHNLFENKVHNGSFIAINADLGRSAGRDRTPRHTRIDHNHFRDMEPLGINGMEAIRLGSAGYRDMAHIDAHTVFEYNLMERVDGERSEIISVKDSGNIIRYNTIVETAGSIVFRFGHGLSVYGNYIIGNGKAGTGGIRIYGADQHVFNNYFSGLTRPAINFGRGNIEEPYDLPRGDLYYAGGEYVRTNRVGVVFNTFVNNDTNFSLSGNNPLEPVDTVVANNLIVTVNNHVVGWGYPELLQHDGISWEHNIVHGPARSTIGLEDTSFRIADPKLAPNIDGVYYISENSPAVDSAVGYYPYVSHDLEGKPRDDHPDVGAFEYRDFPLIYGPLTAVDVGPFALMDRNESWIHRDSAYITEIRFPSKSSQESSSVSGAQEIEIDGVILGPHSFVDLDVHVGDQALFIGQTGFPAKVTLNTFDLDEGTHELIVEVTKGDIRTERRDTFIVENVRVESPAIKDVVSGTWPVRLDVQLPPSDDRNVRVFIGERLIFSGSVVPEEIVFDSYEFGDGSYTMTVEVDRPDGGISRTESDFSVENYWHIDDHLRPPLSFFGQMVDRLLAKERSDGWVHQTDQAGSFFGDQDRVMSGQDDPQYMSWESPGLTEVVVTLYSRDRHIGPNEIELAVSLDGVVYSDLEYTFIVKEKSEAGWFQVMLVAHVEHEQADYFRLTVNRDALRSDHVQIGHVKMVGLKR